ncbi:NfeD family protein [Sphingomonas sp.]|jgi:membrane protein implicated in regulation of membrane protease activity|uniref:NfeD family protein n=1 Tax=Sphingomonas sp. TaxID=28214 RepID=UPI002FC5A93E
MNGIEPHWAWLIAAAVMGIAEILVPGVFLIWLAAAAAVTGVVALALPIGPASQFALFGLLSLAAVYFGRRIYAANPIESSDPLLNDRATRLIGETLVVVAAIENGRGRVAVGDTVWPARGADAAIGSRVRVTGAEGTALLVEPLAAPGSPLPGPG